MLSFFDASKAILTQFSDVVASIPSQLIWGLGVVVAITQINLIRKNTAFENNRKRREYALSYSLTRTPAHVDARQALAEVFGPTTHDCKILELEEIDTSIENDKTVHSKIRVLLNHWENLALSIYQGVADEETAFEMVSQRVINTARHYQHYINRVHNTSPVSFKYLIWLVNRWSTRKTRNNLNPAPLFKKPFRRSFFGSR